MKLALFKFICLWIKSGLIVLYMAVMFSIILILMCIDNMYIINQVINFVIYHILLNHLWLWWLHALDKLMHCYNI